MQEIFSGLMWVVIRRAKVYVNKPSVTHLGECALGVESAIGKSHEVKKLVTKGLLRLLTSFFKFHCSLLSRNRGGHMSDVFFRIPEDSNLWMERPRAKLATVACQADQLRVWV